MPDYIFNTRLYYYSEETGELCAERVALTYPWKSPHTSDILRWMSFDYEGYPPFFGVHPLTLLRDACSVLNWELSERVCFFNYEDARSRDMSKSFHSERYISLYKQKKLAERERIRTITMNQKKPAVSAWSAGSTKNECEKLLNQREYQHYLQNHANVQSREMEFYYCSLQGERCKFIAREWAPSELKPGRWAYKPCIVDREGNLLLRLEGGEEPDPLRALVRSLQSITRYLVSYAERYGILRYFTVEEGGGDHSDTGKYYDVSYLKYILKDPVLWGLAFRMEATGELIMD